MITTLAGLQRASAFEALKMSVCARAGAPGGRLAVRFVSGRMIPPCIVSNGRRAGREVVVSLEWMIECAPKLWAIFLGAKLCGEAPKVHPAETLRDLPNRALRRAMMRRRGTS